MARLKVTQTRSEIGGKQNQRDTLRSLGLKRIGDVVVKEDRPEIRGMVRTVATWSPSRRLTDHGRLQANDHKETARAEGAPPAAGARCQDRQDPRGSR